MKKMILILGCIMLGAYIFGLILGDSPDSMKSLESEFMQQQLDNYRPEP